MSKVSVIIAPGGNMIGRRTIRLTCPHCGARIIDVPYEPDTHVVIMREHSAEVPDYYLKCWRCKNNVGIRRTAG